MSHTTTQTHDTTKTTDKLFEFPFYNRKGKLHRQRVTQSMLAIFLLSLFTFYVLGASLYYHFEYNIDLLLYPKEFLTQSAEYLVQRFQDIQSMGINEISVKEITVLSLLGIISAIPAILFLQRILKKAKIQSNLASIGLEHYYLYKANKKSRTYIFKLLKGHLMKYDTFISQFENMKQLFGEGDIEYSRHKTDMVLVQFKDELIDINDIKKAKSKKLSLSKHLKENRLLLGATSLNGDVLYATLKEEGEGLLNGHWLIIGASGSGKSVSVKSFCMNFLLPQNYKFIDDIYIINYKQSSDYNFLKGLDKVHYAQDIKESLKLLKKIQLNMYNKYLYNTEHDQDNFTAYQTIVIIDEIQTLPEMLDSKSLHKIERNSIQESLSIIESLGSKARASNISLMVILQKADVASLPSTAFRQNLRNRFMLKQENNISASLVINSEILERENIRPLELKQGQFIYLDTLTNELKRGLTLFPDTTIDIKTLNALGFEEETQRVIDEVAANEEASIQTIQSQKEELEELAQSGQKTYCDDYKEAKKPSQPTKKEISKDIDFI